jgi:hypothetical protein
VLAVISVALLVGLVAGRASTPAVAVAPAAAEGPTAAPAAALSSSWFCAGANDERHAPADGELIITNAGAAILQSAVTIVASTGTSRDLNLAVAGESRVEAPETVAGGAAWVGASIVLDGGQATVEQLVHGPEGESVEPCATSGSPTWYFATGETLLNASSTLTLLNPYPEPAIANLSFSTNEGQEQPGDFQGLVVPSGGLLAVPIGSHLRRRSFIATTVSTTAGRVIAWKTDVVTPPPKGAPLLGTKAAAEAEADPASPYVGVTTVLGVPAPSTRWSWPLGATGVGVDEQYVIYDPGSAPARVSLAVRLDQGAAEPFVLSVAPGQVATLATASAARLPGGVGYSATLTSDNGVPVVAERAVLEDSPAPVEGMAEAFGATQAARSWLVGNPPVLGRPDGILAVSAATSAGATVTVDALAGGRLVPIPGLTGVRVGAGGPLQLRLTAATTDGGAALLVTATAPVVVARTVAVAKHVGGLTTSLAVPLAG